MSLTDTTGFTSTILLLTNGSSTMTNKLRKSTRKWCLRITQQKGQGHISLPMSRKRKSIHVPPHLQLDLRKGLNEQSLGHGTYYTIPSLSTLAASDLSHVPKLTVGRQGFGEVEFERHVDLSHLSLPELLGKVVRFQKGVCEVYPDNGPPAGQGINVPAVVRLHGCWPPTIDEKDVDAYNLILRSRPETEYIDYELSTGTWTFRVNHFSAFTVGSGYDFPIVRRSAASSSTSSTSPTSSASPSPTPASNLMSGDSYHILRSQTVYSNPVAYAPSQRKPRLTSLVKEAYEFWKKQRPIPGEIIGKIEEFTLTLKEFFQVFPNLDEPCVNAIELLDGRIKFRCFTTPAHAAIIVDMVVMIASQDVPPILVGTTNMSTLFGFLFANYVKVCPLGKI